MTNRISLFYHCRRCLDEEPHDQTPRQWARLEVGKTDNGEMQVWCVRHDIEVIKVSLSKRL